MGEEQRDAQEQQEHVEPGGLPQQEEQVEQTKEEPVEEDLLNMFDCPGEQPEAAHDEVDDEEMIGGERPDAAAQSKSATWMSSLEPTEGKIPGGDDSSEGARSSEGGSTPRGEQKLPSVPVRSGPMPSAAAAVPQVTGASTAMA